MDPVTLSIVSAVAGSVGGEVVKGLWGAAGQRWFSDYFHNHGQKALEKGQENTTAFLCRLALRLEHLEWKLLPAEDIPRVVSDVLADPDFAASLRTAILSAARTGNEVKHEVLARSIAERLSAAEDSMEAIASNLAVEVIPRLSSDHLSLLGLLALVHAIRPYPLPLNEAPPEGVPSHETSGAEKEALAGYIAWLRQALGHHSLPNHVSSADLAHLAASSCVLIEPKVYRSLQAVLNPGNARLTTWGARLAIDMDLGEFVHIDPLGSSLHGLWSQNLQHVTLTPVGLLIGTTVHDLQAGSRTAITWHLQGPQQDKSVVDDAVWDGRNIRENFLKALDSEIKNRAERGVGIWYEFAKRPR